MTKIGDKESALRRQREDAAKPAAKGQKANLPPDLVGRLTGRKPQPAAATPPAEPPEVEATAATEPEETEVKTLTKRKPGRPSTRRKAKSTDRRKRPAARAAVKRNGTVSAQDVADLMARKGGASMEELTAKFKIDAHPMRAKVFYVRHTLGYDVEHKDGRYHATAPKR